MYGTDIPRYAREYLRDWRRDDRLLRVRYSLDYPGMYILERKTRYLAFPDGIPLGTDRAVQYKDGYRLVLRFWPSEIKWVKQSLDRSDIQKHGGARGLADSLDAEDERVLALADRAMRNEFEAIASEHYDRLAWAEQRRVALS